MSRGKVGFEETKGFPDLSDPLVDQVPRAKLAFRATKAILATVGRRVIRVISVKRARKEMQLLFSKAPSQWDLQHNPNSQLQMPPSALTGLYTISKITTIHKREDLHAR